MRVKFVDNRGFFDDGYYTACIKKIEPMRTPYGQRLLIWLEIKNEHNRKMLINDFVPDECTSHNILAKIYSLTHRKKATATFDTEELIGKNIGIVLVKRIRKGKAYLNVSNYLEIKEDYENTTGSNKNVTDQTISQLATILRNNPALARAIIKEVTKEPKTGRQPKKKSGPSPIGEILDNMKGENQK